MSVALLAFCNFAIVGGRGEKGSGRWTGPDGAASPYFGCGCWRRRRPRRAEGVVDLQIMNTTEPTLANTNTYGYTYVCCCRCGGARRPGVSACTFLAGCGESRMANRAAPGGGGGAECVTASSSATTVSDHPPVPGAAAAVCTGPSAAPRSGHR